MSHWYWLILGLLLLLGAFHRRWRVLLLLGGGAALLTGLVRFAVPGLPGWAPGALFALLFAVGLALVLMRHRGKGRAAAAAVARRKVDPLVGSEGVTLEALAPGRLGRVELAGESWNARLTTSRPLPAGARVRVEGVEGLIVFFSPPR